MNAEKLKTYQKQIEDMLKEQEEKQPKFCDSFVENFKLKNRIFLEEEITKLALQNTYGEKVGAIEQILSNVLSVALAYETGNKSLAFKNCVKANANIFRLMEYLKENNYG